MSSPSRHNRIRNKTDRAKDFLNPLDFYYRAAIVVFMKRIQTTATTQSGESRRKEGLMTSSHSLSTFAITASERGALDGWKVKCSCGFHATTSLSENEARKMGFDHADWAKRAGK